MNEFKTYHPIISFAYFGFVIAFSMVFMHPFCLAVSLVCAFAASVLLKGRKAVKTNLLYMLPVMLLTALVNPLFSHAGATVLCYLPSGNPLTLESVEYGLAAAAMLVGVLCWFSCFNAVMTSDKLVYLFGRAIPSLSLILSMTLRFVPRYAAQLKTVVRAQKCLGRDPSSGSLIERARHGLSILSVLTTWALENAVDTADSMKSRGYGLPGRTAFSIFRFDRRDKAALVCICVLGAYVCVGGLCGALDFHYFPAIGAAECSVFGASVFAAYLALCALPILIELWEVRRWKAIESNT